MTRFACFVVSCLVSVLGLTAAQETGQGASPSWSQAVEKAKALVSKMTDEEKTNITVGLFNTENSCAGLTGSVPRLNFPSMCLNDAAAGLHGTDLVNAYPAGVSVGASWNLSAAYDRALFLGAEFRRKGVGVCFGPVVAPIGRMALNGRNWEGGAADPVLAGKLTKATVQGLQKSVIANIKHLIGYEQETNRQNKGPLPAFSANINDQDMHEVYLWPFQDAVYAGVGSAMCAYNRVNGTYSCENDKLLNTLLKSELNFPGFVLSDFYAQHSGVQSAVAGLDMALPLSLGYWQGILPGAVKNGSLPASRLDDMATRIVAAWYQVLDGAPLPVAPGAGMPKDFTQSYTPVDGRDPASKSIRMQTAIEGHVLVKNVNNALPFKKPKMLSLFGYDAHVPAVHNPTSPLIISPWALGLESVNISISQAIAIDLGNQENQTVPEAATLGTLIGGAGSGANTPSYFSDPYSALQQQAYGDDTYLMWDFQSASPTVNPESSACLVFINEDSSEGIDRAGLADLASDQLVKNVANKCKNTVVVIHNAWIRLVDAWVDHPNVTAVMYAHLPGQDSGRALVEILYGTQSPSGRLPYTVAHKASDYGPLLRPIQPNSGANESAEINFSNPHEIDYRYFLANKITPRYAFGYGLTYSTFSYSGLSVAWTSASHATYPPNPKTKIPGGVASLFDTVATAKFTITNTGSRAAAEVGQLYVKFPGDSAQWLRGFEKVLLQPKQSKTVQVELSRRDISRWDTKAQSWAVQSGVYEILVGSNVLNTPLQKTLKA